MRRKGEEGRKEARNEGVAGDCEIFFQRGTEETEAALRSVVSLLISWSLALNIGRYGREGFGECQRGGYHKQGPHRNALSPQCS